MALLLPAVHQNIKQALRKHWSVGMLGSVTRMGDQHTIKVLSPLRESFAKQAPDPRAERLLAFTMGWRCHNAADRQWKPMYRYLQPEHYRPKQPGVSAVTIYHDVAVFKEVYDHGRRAPLTPTTLQFGPNLPATDAVLPAVALQGLVGLTWQRTLLMLQSFVAKGLPVPARFDKADNRFEPLVVDEAPFAEAYHRPDPDRIRKYIVAANFYDREEAMLVLLEKLRKGGSASASEVNRVRREPKCQYAQAVNRGLGYMEACSEYLVGRIDEATLTERCDLKRPHKPPEVEAFLDKYEKTNTSRAGGHE